MLIDYFKSTRTPNRLRSGVLGPFVEDFTQRLETRGYPPGTIRAYLSTAVHLSFWAAGRNLQARELNEAAGASFLAHLRRCTCLRPNSGKYTDTPVHVRYFLDCLRELNVVEKIAVEARQRSLLDDFRDWMHCNRGVTEATLDSYTYVLTDLLKTVNDDIRHIDAGCLRAFIVEWVRRHARSAAGIAAPAIRMFLRYLIIQGKVRPGLDDAVPSVANWRLSTLPRFLPAAEIDRTIASCDLTTELGTRNRAILLLLARLGLRAGDVVRLQLKDIDWSQATIRLSGKGRREVKLPLTQEVGDALLTYLNQRHNQENEGPLFIRARAPLRPLSAHGTVSSMVARALARAGVCSPARGAHVLRHSAATEMLRQGASLQSIGAVLRHRSIDTTEQYAKVDTKLLRLVVQPWPEVTSC